MLRFNLKYFLLSLLLFITEIAIALYLHDEFIRPYVGDYLVVMLLYCMVRTIYQAPAIKVAIAVLIFSYLIEIGQYFHLVNLLGLQHNKLARVVIGTSFAWSDIIAYTLGILTVIILDKKGSSNL
jgi:DNA integrity scanning protein DisA with diadenylate cyclase activity